MSFFESLVAGPNLPFTAAIATVLTFAALQATGVLGLLAGGDADHDVDGDADHDLDAAAEHDLDGDADHDLDGDADHDADTDHDGERAATGFLATVGFGRLPTTIIWQTFAITFGLTGILANTAIHAVTSQLSAASLVVSLPLAIVGGFVLTALTARLVAKVVKPPAEAPGKRDLVGLPGTVVSGRVDDQFGEIRVKSRTGDFVQVACRVLPGEKPLAHHDEVVIVQYDRALDRVFVTPATPEPAEKPATGTRIRS